jgi:hypothetical protein
LLELIVLDKGNLDVFDSQYLWTCFSGRCTTAVHRVGFGFAAIFKPNRWPLAAGRVEQGKVLEIVGDKGFNFNKLVIEGGRVLLELANGDLLGFFA